MTHRPVSFIVLAAFALISFSCRADMRITQCINEAGETTYSDAPCEAGSVDSMDADTAGIAPQLVVRQMPREGKYAAAEDARTLVWANRRFAKRQPTSDMTTVQTARFTAVA